MKQESDLTSMEPPTNFWRFYSDSPDLEIGSVTKAGMRVLARMPERDFSEAPWFYAYLGEMA